eukprot:1154767-Pelagomonas_calceolata.AAC.5
MTLALQRAICSAILITEATATLMFLPANSKLIPTQNSSLLTSTFATSSGPCQKGNLPTTTPNPGPARKLLSLSIPGTSR